MLDLNRLGARMDFDLQLKNEDIEYTILIKSRIRLQTYMRDVLEKEVDEIYINEVIANIHKALPFSINEVTIAQGYYGPIIVTKSEIPLKDFNKYFREDIYEFLSCKHFSASGYELILSPNLQPMLRERNFEEKHPPRRLKADERYETYDDSEVFEEVD